MPGNAGEEDAVDRFGINVFVVNARSQSPAAQRRCQSQERARNDDNHIEEKRALREAIRKIEEHRSERPYEGKSHSGFGVRMTYPLIDEAQELPGMIGVGLRRDHSLGSPECQSKHTTNLPWSTDIVRALIARGPAGFRPKPDTTPRSLRRRRCPGCAPSCCLTIARSADAHSRRP